MLGIILFYALLVALYFVLTSVSFHERYSKRAFKWIKRTSIIALTLVFLISCAFDTFFQVGEQEYVVVETLGIPTAIYDPGMNYKFPFLSSKTHLDSTIQGMAIGYDEWSNESIEKDSLMITADFNLLNIDFYAEYRIVDASEYLYGSTDPEGILKSIICASIRNTVRRYNIDLAMTTGKFQIQSAVLDDVTAELKTVHTGLSLVSITVQDAEPPTETVKAAFRAVETARQQAEKKVNEAQAYENKMIPQAEANAEAIIKEAEAKKVERINSATQEVSVFNALYEEYSKNPETVKNKLYFQVTAKVFPKLQVIMADDNVVIIK